MNKKSKLHMNTQEFRKEGYKVIDWIADYYDNIEEYPVLSKVKPGEIRNNLPKNPPQKGREFDDILKDMDLMMPGITHWQSPNFHAFFPCSNSGPAILGDLISTGIAVNGMNWITSPSATEVESHVLDWMVNALNLPDQFLTSSLGGGVIQDTASSSSLVAMIAAREKITLGETNKTGCKQNLTVYTSSQSHSSIEKAAKIAGIGTNNFRIIDIDENYAMNANHLLDTIKQDINKGFIPTLVSATVGTTSSTAIDPVDQIGKICKKYNIWLHVDSAMAGPAAICPEFRFVNDGLEFADSYTFNPHKWMLTNFDCNIFYVKDRKYLLNALSILPEYLKNKATEKNDVIDYRDWGIPLGRRFRSLKLWNVINYYGINGIQEYIRTDMRITQELKSWIEADENFEILAPTPLTLICFKYKANDDFNEKLLRKMNASGKMYMSHTKLNGKFAIRFSIGTSTSTKDHVKSTWRRIQKCAIELKG
tara:strand:+ start:255 stop:1691 length:1437 start_codon:yes stop_codon:yes gene_type:complete